MADQKVYFMQHGLAVDKADDPQRPLSEAGIRQTEKLADTLRASGTMITRVFHSGKLRAAQTAEIMANAMGLDVVTMIEGLSPNDEVTLLSQKIDSSDTLYVGHLPHLEKLVAHLITGNETTQILRFQNSGIICLEKNDEGYHIQWLLTPATVASK